ncbi:MAG: HD domain-containing protein [Bacteroidales bacterium]
MPYDFIIAAENKYKNILAGECRRIFSGTDMPSHDQLHHERVWENASLLLKHLSDGGMTDDPRLAEKAITASYFHDTGLTLNRGTNHGRESRMLCTSFLESTDFTPEEKLEILDAVERHDDKDYPVRSDPSSLAAIISVADDMDAFGRNGIERYTEIYSVRGVSPEEMPGLIIFNVMSRFRHLETTYGMFPGLVEEQRAGAAEVTDHFTNKI